MTQDAFVEVHKHLGALNSCVHMMKESQKKSTYDADCILMSCKNVCDQVDTEMSKVDKMFIELGKYQTDLQDIFVLKEELQEQLASHKQPCVTRDEIKFLEKEHYSIKSYVDDLVSNTKQKFCSEDACNYNSCTKIQIKNCHKFKSNEILWHHDKLKKQLKKYYFFSIDRKGLVNLRRTIDGETIKGRKEDIFVNQISSRK